MAAAQQIPLSHTRIRSGLRIAGPILFGVGVLCMIVAAIDFFTAFGDFDNPPTLFWLFFVGIPLIFVGSALSMYGFAGALATYQVREASPAASEAINRVGTGGAPGIQSVAAAVAQGLKDSSATPSTPCPNCGSAQDHDAQFCDDCGAHLPRPRACSSCSAENDADARFCNACGASITRA